MHVTFFAADKDRENALAHIFSQGVHQCGDTCEIVRPVTYKGVIKKSDVAVLIGVKGYSQHIFHEYLAAHKHTVYADKGYLGRGRSWRFSIDSFQPLSYFQRVPRPFDRIKKHNIQLRPMRTEGAHVIIAGGSLKYAEWHHFPSIKGYDPMTSWAQRVIRQLQHITSRPLIYRPKPSWQEAISIAGIQYSRPPTTLQDILSQAWALVTFGSNAAVEALIAGVPVIILGDGIAQPLAKQSINSIEDPYIPSDEERWQFLADIAYCQFVHQEIIEGTAWDILRQEIVYQQKRQQDYE